MKKKMAFGTVVFAAVSIMALGLQAIGADPAYAVPAVTDVVKFQGTATLTEAPMGSTHHFNLSFSQPNPSPPDITGGCFNVLTGNGCTLALSSGATVTGCPAPSEAAGTFTITEGTATTTVTIGGNSPPATVSFFVAGQGAFRGSGDKSSIPGSPDSIVVGELVAIPNPNGLPGGDPCNRDGMSSFSVTVVGTITVVTT